MLVRYFCFYASVAILIGLLCTSILSEWFGLTLPSRTVLRQTGHSFYPFLVYECLLTVQNFFLKVITNLKFIIFYYLLSFIQLFLYNIVQVIQWSLFIIFMNGFLTYIITYFLHIIIYLFFIHFLRDRKNIFLYN